MTRVPARHQSAVAASSVAKLAEARAQERVTAVGPLAMEVARSGRSDGSGQEVEAVAAEALVATGWAMGVVNVD